MVERPLVVRAQQGDPQAFDSAEQRAVLVLQHYLNYSHARMADVLGVPVGAAPPPPSAPATKIEGPPDEPAHTV